MDDWRHEEALFRYGLIAAALDARLSNAERGALVRALALRLHAHPSGDQSLAVDHPLALVKNVGRVDVGSQDGAACLLEL